MKPIQSTIALSTVAILLSACASNFAPGFYTPQLSEELGGVVKIETFTSNQPELAQKSAKAGIDDMNIWLSEFFTDAVTQEFMQMNAYDDNAKCTLSGDITHYNWGANAVELNVTYNLQKNGKTIFTATTDSNRPLHQAMQLQIAQTMLHRTMTDSVDQLVKDDRFMNKMKQTCN